MCSVGFLPRIKLIYGETWYDVIHIDVFLLERVLFLVTQNRLLQVLAAFLNFVLQLLQLKVHLSLE